jgi:hypothetical protein
MGRISRARLYLAMNEGQALEETVCIDDLEMPGASSPKLSK